MGIKAQFSPDDIHQEMLRRMQIIHNAYISGLDELGMRCVEEARDTGSYQDQTGNLRSSVGYLILEDGKVVREDFRVSEKPTKGKSDKVTGMNTARSLATSLALKYPAGLVLIVVAGMNYAAYVEARNRNVLSTAEHLCQAELPRMVAELKSDVKA